MSLIINPSTSSSTGSVSTLTGNSGGAVGPTLGNINIVGSGGVSVAGNPGTSTLTITAAGSVATTYNEDSGSATPAANILNIVGGTGIVTSGSGNTVTISTTGTTNLTYRNVPTGDSPYTVLTTDDYLSAAVSGGPVTIRLPSTPVLGKVYIIKDREGLAATNNITVTTVGGVTNIDAAPTFVMNTAYESINVIGNGTTYEVY